jgi:hypothetical protein
MSDTQPKNDNQFRPSRFGQFIQTYHTFLSTFVIGAAGLIATSIWQYKQSDIARWQAQAQQRIAVTQAENNWRIERAEILSKNLQVLAASGQDSVEQRYGVLLSLTRGNIIDPELAVSYALELGKDNADYMRSVLASTADKSYARLASAFELTCAQRFGVVRDAPICKTDTYADRSDAIAELMADETVAALKQNKRGPAALLDDERDVQATPARMSWLFTPYLSDLYERRQWKEIDRFEAFSNGARLVSSLVLGPARSTELIAASEVTAIERFHTSRLKWLLSYLLASSCDGECKGKLVDFMITSEGDRRNHFDVTLRTLLGRPRAEITGVLTRLHARLLSCQMDTDALETLRDQVLVPALLDEAGKGKPDLVRIEDLLGLVALVPEPRGENSNAAGNTPHDAWGSALDKARNALKDRYQQAYTTPRASAATTRKNPPLALRKTMFCDAAVVTTEDAELSEE